MTNPKKRPCAARRLYNRAKIVVHRLLHGIAPSCPYCLSEFTRQARIEYFVGDKYPGNCFRRVFKCDACGREFPTGLMRGLGK